MTTTQTAGSTFYGWWMVGAAFVLALFGWGMGFYGPPVYLSVVHETTGWPVALISTAGSGHFLFGGPLGAHLPSFFRRFFASAGNQGSGLFLSPRAPRRDASHF